MKLDSKYHMVLYNEKLERENLIVSAARLKVKINIVSLFYQYNYSILYIDEPISIL